MKGKTLFAVVMSAMLLSTMASADVLDFTAESAEEANAVVALAEEKLNVSLGSNDNCVTACLNNGTRENVIVTLGNLPSVSEKFAVKMYHDNILLSTTTMKDSLLPYNGGGISVNIVYSGELSGSWNTVIENTWTASRIPNKFVISIDNYAEQTINFNPDNYGISGNPLPTYATDNWYNLSLTETSSDLSDKIASAEAGDTIDLGGKTYIIDERVVINKAVTFTNGTLDISNFVLPHGNGIFEIKANATFDGVNVVGKDYSSAFSVMFANAGTTLTLNNCNFNLENELPLSNEDTPEEIGGVLKAANASAKYIINGGTYNFKNTVRCITDAEVEIDGAKITATHDATSTAGFFRNVFGTIANSTISADNFQNGIKNTAGNKLDIKTSTVTFTNMSDSDVMLSKGAVLSVDADSTVTMGKTDMAASIGTTYYGTLDAALKAATDNDTVKMLADATIKGRFDNKDTAMTLDLNDKTLTVDCGTKTDCYFRKMTFKNGNIKVIGESSTAAFYAWYPSDYLVFDNVEIDANDFAGLYLIADDLSNSNSRIEIINGTEINYNSDVEKELSTVIHLCGKNGTLKIDNSKINVANTNGHIINNNGGDVVISGNSEITGTNVGTSGIFNVYGKSLTVTDNATITITGVEGSTKWNPEKAGIVLGADTLYTVADTATVNANVYRTPTAENLTNTVKVSFADVTANEGEAVYDIYVEAEDEKTINRLTAVQMALKLTTTDAFEMTVTAADGVMRSFENGMYLFNFDGETKPSATGAKIKIAQVKFVGYGKFSLEVTDGQAHATTINGENVVTDYVVDGEEGKGIFDKGDGIVDAEVVRPTRKLTINVAFNNSVENQAAAYQAMTVKVTGAKGYSKVFNLGSDAFEIKDNGAVIVIDNELTLNETYNVEVSGAGYRTAYYSVNMKEDKVLNFWNNYKDEAAEVEEGKESSAKNATFLAGEIVKDGKINIYDLSAVVSYFGTETDVTAESEYAKYDLNRDGKIDSKDVAYVLVSWGK